MILFVLTIVGAFAASVPELQGRVNDYASLLSGDEKGMLESKLENYEQESSNQFVLLTIQSLEGETVEDFSIRALKKWKLGQADKNNGILVVFAKDERKLRIEVGYGLEGAVPDAIASNILRNEIAKLTKQDKFYEGFSAGFDALMLAANGEYEGEKETSISELFTSGQAILGVVIGVILFFIGIVIEPFSLYALICVVAGGTFGYFGWDHSLLALFLLALCSFVLAIFVFVIKNSSGGSGYSSGGGYSGGDWSLGGSSGGSSGFSGGGGDGGGGGASGDG